jgi:hypothetical protein
MEVKITTKNGRSIWSTMLDDVLIITSKPYENIDECVASARQFIENVFTFSDLTFTYWEVADEKKVEA